LVRIITRFIGYGYWLLLTVLLLVPNPATLVGLRAVPIFPWGKFGIHMAFFTVLGFLVNTTRWPRRPWWPLIALLFIYGITTETLQFLVPHRTAQIIDAIENISGIALGTAAYWMALWWMNPQLANEEATAEG
jgi:glycopeptide antibiotics resistance protein